MAEYIDRNNLPKIPKGLNEKGVQGFKMCLRLLKEAPTEDVVPSSEVEELKKQLNDYKRFVGEIRVAHDNHAVIIDSENVTHIDKRVAEGMKNLAVKQAKQDVAREIFEEIAEILKNEDKRNGLIGNDYGDLLITDIGCGIGELKKKYIGGNSNGSE